MREEGEGKRERVIEKDRKRKKGREREREREREGGRTNYRRKRNLQKVAQLVQKRQFKFKKLENQEKAATSISEDLELWSSLSKQVLVP